MSDDRVHSDAMAGEDEVGLSRRRMFHGVAALGVAGAAGGLLASAVGTANAAPAPDSSGVTSAVPGEPMVAHVRDVHTGEVDVFVGERHVQLRDPQLAASIARAVR